MAQAVEQALKEKRHLIAEAGTGTGKTLAYLVPVIRSGKRVIISTGTKNLQEQLFYKDVPFLEQALGSGLSVCYMKGRNNYLCRKKLYDLTDRPVLGGLEETEQYRAIAAWEKNTATGDRAELAELPEASLLWHKLDARAETGADSYKGDVVPYYASKLPSNEDNDLTIAVAQVREKSNLTKGVPQLAAAIDCDRLISRRSACSRWLSLCPGDWIAAAGTSSPPSRTCENSRSSSVALRSRMST